MEQATGLRARPEAAAESESKTIADLLPLAAEKFGARPAVMYKDDDANWVTRNFSEVIETVRTEFRGEPYWQRALDYAHAGGLQAVLDEYAHLLKESLGIAAAPVAEIAEKISAELIAALTLRTASLRIDDITAPFADNFEDYRPQTIRTDGVTMKNWVMPFLGYGFVAIDVRKVNSH